MVARARRRGPGAAATGEPALTDEARAERRTILQGDRAKAYRPLDAAARRAAFEAGLAAYRRDDFFEAHELLEPAWMGTDDLAERALYQGLIKLAAAYVHGARRNPAGVRKNLEGARLHLQAARSDEIDLAALLAAVDERLAALPDVLPAPALPALRRG